MCTAFAASDVQILKGTQLPLSLALAFWFRIRVGDIPEAPCKEKKMSGTSALLRRSCWTKSNRKTSDSTSSKIRVCEIECLKRGQYKVLSIKVSALEKNFLFIFLSESIWYVRLCEGWYFGSSCFVTDWVNKLLLYTEAETRTNCSVSR